jgi:hypothetical protein
MIPGAPMLYEPKVGFRDLSKQYSVFSGTKFHLINARILDVNEKLELTNISGQ